MPEQDIGDMKSQRQQISILFLCLPAEQHKSVNDRRCDAVRCENPCPRLSWCCMDNLHVI